MQAGTSEKLNFLRVGFADPNLLLQRTLRECPNLAELYAQKLTERPCDVNNPWSLIVVFDAFTPASLSCPRPANVKTMNLAFNFLELGSSALCVDATWLLPVSVRNEMVEEAVGGWSACLAIYLRAHLLGGTSIQFVGVPTSTTSTTSTTSSQTSSRTCLWRSHRRSQGG